MMNDGKNSNPHGFSFTGALTLIFITLKLCRVIDWSWGWVLSPLWIGAGLAMIIITVAVVAKRHGR